MTDTSRTRSDPELMAPEAGPEQPEGAAAAEAAPVGKRSSLWGDAWADLRRNPLFVVSALLIALFVAMAVVPQWFSLVAPEPFNDPQFSDLSRSLDPPSAQHWFGFDVQGRDLFVRVVYGARNSLRIGLLTVLGATAIALLLGCFAGYYGGWLDAVVARFADIFFAIPVVLAGIAFLNVIGDRSWITVSLVLCAFGWPTMMRIARSAVLSEKEREYVMAARALGARDHRIILRHIVPNSIAPVVVYATIFTGVIIGAEATLSFLGVGLQLPAISWGLMVAEAQTRVLQAPHILLFPGAFISVTVFSFILMGDALRDALDPRLR